MLFNSGIFLLFFILCFSLLWVLSGNRPRHWLLLISSYVFYGWWDWRFLGLILFITAVAYFGALFVHDGKSARVRQIALISTITMSLGVLFFFKYFGFFIDSLGALVATFGLTLAGSSLEIILPVGISFYTFQAISYIVDVRRGVLPADHHPLEVALYIAFFPQLVAGPIVRATDFLPQLRQGLKLDADALRQGIAIFLIGFLYKAVIADNLGRLADPIFADVQAWSRVSHWVAILAYYGQIYFDFAGYSGMAIGIARLLGFWLPINFNYPYSSASITEFWRRWHISLSSWLRDYLYIPLGGNRVGILSTYRNLFLTMLLGGFWHGASWNFIVWGAMHGAALIVHKLWTSGGFSHGGNHFFVIAVAWVITQLWVLIAWVFFRAESFDDSYHVLGSMFGLSGQAATAAHSSPLLLLLVITPIAVDTVVGRIGADKKWQFILPDTLYALFLGFLVAAMVWSLPLTLTPFVYFQF
ncbi:MAG TPA: MBOAT family protein [Chromatiaceae bacterium]|jgi:alginate O-acetyltransferase complex protein AlgI|nr:MAG: hypothetical protein N838_13770 [Thiohalocapsa sp. PB-PSB1]QQO53925.1 MAG: MBOAT family protein [Thiohalocapsa sp. PB-PSB1]HBG95186.1 MBOAT family protein [Chromatiaceae bacterium]HCS89752.1 MBOAT family protein [Chromatiaceae bacterium]